MAHDYHVEEAEEQFREQKTRELLREQAAEVSVNKHPRKVAERMVAEREADRTDAVAAGQVFEDEEGAVITFLDPKLDPPLPADANQKQIFSIHKDLCEAQGISHKPVLKSI